jgi:2-oxoglutarate dehydrogenase E1 component
MDTLSWLHHMSPQEIEELYQNYLKDRNSVDIQWIKFFEGFEFARTSYSEEEPRTVYSDIGKEFRVLELIQDYRKRGHYFTATNPVRKRRTYSPDLNFLNYGLNENDLQIEFAAGNELGLGKSKLSEIIAHLQETYCRSVGVEFMYIRLPNIVDWLRERMETSRNRPDFGADEKKILIQHLAGAVSFERFLQKRFPGQKRFSLEGAENFIPAIHTLIDYGSVLGVTDFIFGMAHRGRLNMLANVMHKPGSQIFAEFEGKEFDEDNLLGDVKYHMGYVFKDKLHGQGEVQLILCPNPSHLEAVGPVVQGLARSISDIRGQGVAKVIPVVVHGDASVAGQGVVYEQVQMSELSAHSAGGTIHIVINNQIGFTTDYLDGRSSIYCTDVAKVIQSPIFHVNGDDVEAVAYVMKLALDYRMKFHKDVFVDLLCYRRHGHNESDEPRYTQPLLYKAIEEHDDPLKIYSKQLIAESLINEQFVNNIQLQYFEKMDKMLDESKQLDKVHMEIFLEDRWKSYIKADEDAIMIGVVTAVELDILLELGRKINVLPAGVKAYSKLKRLLESRQTMLENDAVDWALAEQLAFATLLNEGSNVRFCGQDVERGTFSHRHAVFTFEETGEKYLPLNHLRDGQAKFEIFNSLLSEYAVLGFEYGYAFYRPNDLTIWEAQFGDFANGAQIVIDQFIASAEEKWGVMNNLVLFLPHGYEGQGPEHSSARIERFLNLCANYNMDVIQCSTPSNFFHALRRHLKRSWRKPLVMLTPKSLLRYPECVSSLNDFSSGQFRAILNDYDVNPLDVTHFVLCSGKVYYDIIAARRERNIANMAVVRLEQLYPFALELLQSILDKFPRAEKFTWVQDEPANMGAWGFLSKWLRPMDFTLVSRPFSSSPAAGSSALHKLRQKKIIDKLFGECVCERNSKECKMLCLGSTPENIQL